MPKHTKLTGIGSEDGKYNFCLDRITDGDFPYSIVWRGTKDGPDRFIPRPAYFDFQMLGKLIRQAVTEKKVSGDEFVQFLRALTGL